MAYLEIKNLNKKFNDKIVIKDFNLSVGKGEIIALSGPSGCGKSTILNMIGLLESIDSGDIIFEGNKIPNINSSSATKYRRNIINYIFQSYALINDMSVEDNLLVAMKYIRKKKDIKIDMINEVLDKLKIRELKKQLVSTLSGGEQQRVAIARCILKPGDLILADEPTGSLDNKLAFEIFSLLEILRKDFNKTIILVSHDLNLVSKADKVIKLETFKTNNNYLNI